MNSSDAGDLAVFLIIVLAFEVSSWWLLCLILL